jgi:hypothetical protein
VPNRYHRRLVPERPERLSHISPSQGTAQWNPQAEILDPGENLGCPQTETWDLGLEDVNSFEFKNDPFESQNVQESLPDITVIRSETEMLKYET